ncbi:MAG: SDR family NAD(P)-dependent oxidoreductase [Spirochaetaceae bacterium]
MDIRGKWALVTGASRGVGLRIARALAEKGCKVILHSRKLEGTKDLLDELKAEGVEAFSVAAELSSLEQVEALIKEVKEITSDHLDILYNNAAIMTAYRDMFAPTAGEYMDSFFVNSVVPSKLCDAFLPSMLKRDWGRVVNVTSGIADQPQLMAYSCSKAALDRYVRDMVTSLKDTNVLMSLLDPGWLTTDLGGPDAPNSPDTVLPGAMIPVLLEKEEGSGKFFSAQDYNLK